MKALAVKKAINIAFVVGIFLPLMAAVTSGKLVGAIKTAWLSPQDWPREKEVLRRSTPLWVKAVENYTLAMYALGTTSNPGAAVVGQDGFVFLGDDFNHNFSQAIGRRVYSEHETSDWLEVLRLQQAWLKGRGADVLFVVAPAKWSIYEDKLPGWVEKHQVHRSFDQLLAKRGDLPLLDVRQELRDARRSTETYSPLNSHWTDYGAMIAWKRIGATLADLNPRMKGLYVPEYAGVVTEDAANEFDSMLGLKKKNPWTMPVYTSALPPYEVLDDQGNVTATLGGAEKTDLLYLPRRTRGGSKALPLKVLVMRDSMGNSLSPFFQAAFAETIQVDHRLGTPASATDLVPLVKKYNPDLVIYVMTERYLDGPLGQVQRWRYIAQSQQ